MCDQEAIMHHHPGPSVVFWLLIVALLGACGAPPIAAATSTAPPTEAPTSTVTPIPTATDTPSPTPIPGVEIYPVSTLGNGIPWLPTDPSRRPFSAYYGFNFRKPPFNSLAVRRAFAAAVDKDRIAEEALGFKMRESVPATTLTPASVLARDLYGDVGMAYDPENARVLLAEGGYADPSNFPHIVLMVYLRSSAAPGVHFRLAESAAEMWEANLGITVEIRTVENPRALISRFENEAADMFVIGWAADYIDPDNFLNALFHSGAEINLGGYRSPSYDSLVDRAASMQDPAERQMLYIRAEQMLTEEQTALIPLFHSLSYQP
jgi:ABC-type oligopeptide transport system substrate-binding subunit